MKRLILMACTILFIQLLWIFSMNVSASEPLFECNTDPELIQEMHDALVRKRTAELAEQVNSDISAFSLIQDVSNKNLMPSTGEARVLVLPIEFQDYKISEKRCSELQEEFFGKYNENLPFKELSVSGTYKRLSYGKLNISGDVMPVYTASENMEYYIERSDFYDLIGEALQSYIDFDFSKYDGDGDGYVDAICVKYPSHDPFNLEGVNTFAYGYYALSGKTFELGNEMKAKGITVTLNETNYSDVDIHEIGHLLGLADNYDKKPFSTCVIDGVCEDIMTSSDNYYLNAYYKYLLEWIEPAVLPYTDETKEVELYAVEKYSEENADKTKAVIFIPDSEQLPFSEYYLAEYRAGGIGGRLNDSPGVMLWHCSTEINTYGQYLNKTSYLKSVYKSNDATSYKAEDLYTAGDEFSDTTTPSSKFYDDVYTGAYMKVLSMDKDKATILAGFKEPDLTPAPKITISPPSKKAVKSGEKLVTYTITYDTDNLGDTMTVFKDITIDKTGTASTLQGMSVPKDNVVTFELESIKGEGTLGITVNGKAAWNVGSLGGIKYAPAVTSEIFYVDNTPPEIVLKGESEITIEQGAPYVELGAEVTDNLDPEIEDKLKITGVVNVNQPGTYYVYYNATDHAGNIAEQVVRTVTVLEAPPPPEDKIEITKITSKIYLAKLIFETVVPPPAEEIQMYFACKNDGILQYSELLEVNQDMTTAFYIPPQCKDCDIEIYVWDRKMRPLMPMQRVDRTIFE